MCTAGVDLYAFPHDWRQLTTDDMMVELFKLIQRVSSQIGKKVVMGESCCLFSSRVQRVSSP